MDDEIFTLPQDNGIRDIHYFTSKYKQQRMMFRQQQSAYNYHNWLIYARWIVGRGRKNRHNTQTIKCDEKNTHNISNQKPCKDNRR